MGFNDATRSAGSGRGGASLAAGEQLNRAYLYNQNCIDQEDQVIILIRPLGSAKSPRGLFAQDRVSFSLSASSDSLPIMAWAKAITVGISPLESQYSALSTSILSSRKLGSSFPLGK